MPANSFALHFRSSDKFTFKMPYMKVIGVSDVFSSSWTYEELNGERSCYGFYAALKFIFADATSKEEAVKMTAQINHLVRKNRKIVYILVLQKPPSGKKEIYTNIKPGQVDNSKLKGLNRPAWLGEIVSQLFGSISS